MSAKTASFDSPWRFWPGVAILAAAMTGYMLLSWAHMEFVRQTVGLDAYLGEGPRLPPEVLMIGQINKAVALLAAVAIGALALHRVGPSRVGLTRVAWRWIWLAVLVGAVAFALRLVLAKLMVVVMPDWIAFMGTPFALDPANGVWMSVGFLVMTILVTPFAEEVFFRGFLFRWMSGNRPVWLAALVSSVMFGVAHILPPQAISAVLMALILCWLYWRTGSIWPAVVAHITNNALGISLGLIWSPAV
ncbi:MULTISPECIES: CPBP family intramembrane glutamic endopeptidase [Maricaulis]|jgi:membrane protease YdiL (CAAX protease family)|uniref:Abortive infection protein n=1 Tax=Maricaulis maris (strain MCS10) TaxID=394221 RepID=Q0AMU2_MARMM|nr:MULTISPECIES: CPBP family intramembrane glutamic endopeptidase [Maricaulis]ABI66395.1 Abortive infection protein [Maricaulis maris MCS10]MAC89198.1 CPBP family intramembrane metalloprotease [Maricaulis sp.]